MKKLTRKGIKRDIKRFLKLTEPDPKSECIVFKGHLDSKGYGRFRSQLLPTQRGMVQAHRFAYYIVRGPIPGDMTIDHLCHNTSCVNPYHLEVVSRPINTARGNRDRTRV
ncbi:hypothetical protein LCGC14_2047120 [marine sediment metagenome]|uniref:HNH nuclease domain-containing protein n=1 Tax=marine sediment metagenome TaxID=412755 RepID=A0A0F9H3J2_9ZZZZ